MRTAGAWRSCQLEFRKARRQHDGLPFAALLAVDLAYLFWGMRRADAGALATAWEQTLFSVPLVNTLFLSVTMATMSSRVMDREHKGGTWNLLQTLQARWSLYLGKTLYGLAWMLAFGVVQGASVVAIGSHLGYPGPVPVSRIVALAAAEVFSGMAVYQLGCLLALLYSSQYAALSVNLGGTLAGLFLLFVTDLPVTPWSLLAALRVVDMSYQPGDGSTSYAWRAAPALYWATALLFFALVLAVGLCIYGHMEEGTLSASRERRTRSAGAHAPLPAELIKLRRSPIWVPFFVVPAISAAIGTFNFLGNQGVLSFSWEELWTQHSLFLGTFFLPPLIATLCSHLWRMEHVGTNWNLVLTLESPGKLVADKLLVASVLSAFCVLWVGALYVGCGLGVGLAGLPPVSFLEVMLRGTVSCVAISAAQVFRSLVIRSFALPVGLALGGSAVGIACVVKGWVYALPYAMLQTGLGSTALEWETSTLGFIAAAAAFVALFYLLSVAFLRLSDAKTNE